MKSKKKVNTVATMFLLLTYMYIVHVIGSDKYGINLARSDNLAWSDTLVQSGTLAKIVTLV